MRRKLHTNKNITVAHILNGLTFGGNENLCLQIISGMPKDINNVLINLNPLKQEMLPVFKQVANLNIINQSCSGGFRLKLMINLFRSFRRFQPNSVIIYSLGNLIFAGLAARVAFIPTIVVRAGNTAPVDPSLRRKWKIIIFFARMLRIPIYSCSSAVHKSLMDIGKLPKGSFAICNGCDVGAISRRAKLSRETKKNNSIKVIGMVARLDKIKDHFTLIKAFSAIRNKIPESKLWLIGEGEEKNKLEELIQKLRLKDSVVFWGNRSDIPELLGQMDVFVFSTGEDEGFGIALIEAMAAGLPIVASNVSACREVLGNGEAGLLAGLRNSDIMANLLERLLLSKEERMLWGSHAFDYVLKHYSDKKCLSKWYSILLE